MKLIIIDIVSLSRDAIHVHVGFLALIITLMVSKKKMHQWIVLLPTFILSLLMEALDLFHDYYHVDRVLIIDSIHDVLNTNLIPFILVLWARRELRLSTKAAS